MNDDIEVTIAHTKTIIDNALAVLALLEEVSGADDEVPVRSSLGGSARGRGGLPSRPVESVVFSQERTFRKKRVREAKKQVFHALRQLDGAVENLRRALRVGTSPD